MPDITMCDNTKCPLRNSCYRFTAEPNKYRQSYFAEKPKLKDGKCEYLMPIIAKSDK